MLFRSLENGSSTCAIALEMGIHYSTVSKYRSKYLPDLPKSKGGCPLKLSSANICYATRLLATGKAENASQLAGTLRKLTSKSLTSQTIRNYLKRAGFRAVVKKKKPRLTKEHRKHRLDFAFAHQHWTIEDWKKVVWSDETKINRFGSDGRVWVWKQKGEKNLIDREISETLKFGGGSLMMWGCMLWEGTGVGYKIDGKMEDRKSTRLNSSHSGESRMPSSA